MSSRVNVRTLARRSIARGDPFGWFEELYRQGESDPTVVPWRAHRPNPLLVSWMERRALPSAGRRALVVGCGYGDDAEWLAARGFDVTAFDISRTAIAAARRRFPRSSVHYQVENALEPPSEWRAAFDFVFEAYTLQVLPRPIRVRAAAAIAECVRGTLLVICRGRDVSDDPGDLPWPLTRQDLAAIPRARPDIVERAFEDFLDDEVPAVRRFRVEYGVL